MMRSLDMRQTLEHLSPPRRHHAATDANPMPPLHGEIVYTELTGWAICVDK